MRLPDDGCEHLSSDSATYFNSQISRVSCTAATAKMGPSDTRCWAMGAVCCLPNTGCVRMGDWSARCRAPARRRSRQLLPANAVGPSPRPRPSATVVRTSGRMAHPPTIPGRRSWGSRRAGTLSARVYEPSMPAVPSSRARQQQRHQHRPAAAHGRRTRRRIQQRLPETSHKQHLTAPHRGYRPAASNSRQSHWSHKSD